MNKLYICRNKIIRNYLITNVQINREIPYTKFIILLPWLWDWRNRRSAQLFSLSEAVQRLQFIFAIISNAFCGYYLKRVPTLAVIYKIFYGFHRSFVIPDNWKLCGFLFQLVSCFRALCFDILFWYGQASIVDGKVKLLSLTTGLPAISHNTKHFQMMNKKSCTPLWTYRHFATIPNTIRHNRKADK